MSNDGDALRMLDTSTAIEVISRASLAMEQRLLDLPSKAVCISAMTRTELVYSLAGMGNAPAAATVRQFLGIIKTAAWDAAAADLYAELRHRLDAEGSTVGEKDLEIAAHAASKGAVLVTTDVARFQGICAGLVLESWSV